MVGNTALNQLIKQNVLEANGNDQLRQTESFRMAVEENRQTLMDANTNERSILVANMSGCPPLADTLNVSNVSDAEFIARYITIYERTSGFSPTQIMTLTVVVGQVERGVPRTEGAPIAFLSVEGQDLIRLARSQDRAIIYAWRSECEPCQTVRSDLDNLFGDDPPGDLLLLAVYGPGCSRILDQEFDVKGAPTLLFTLDGQVDARIVGAPSIQALKSEIQALRERTISSAK